MTFLVLFRKKMRIFSVKNGNSDEDDDDDDNDFLRESNRCYFIP
jgi:hypothetical protein